MVLPLLAVSSLLTAFSPLPAPTSTPTESEAEGLAFLREEEKLAHDLYLALDDLYELLLFSHIARRESTHMRAILTLPDSCELPDPAEGLPASESSDPTLQAQHDDLLGRAQASVEEALRVAAQVEGTDTLDLQERLARTARTARAGFTRVRQNLLRRSGNHLRAFAGEIERLSGKAYLPAALGAAATRSAERTC